MLRTGIWLTAATALLAAFALACGTSTDAQSPPDATSTVVQEPTAVVTPTVASPNTPVSGGGSGGNSSPPSPGSGATPGLPDHGDPVPPIRLQPIPPSAPNAPAGTHLEEAPIDALNIVAAESFPPQYFAQVQAGLPSGCAKVAGQSIERKGNVIYIKVYNSMPDGAVACTAIYGMYQVNLGLGSDFTPGVTYTVDVNGKQTTFVAQ